MAENNEKKEHININIPNANLGNANAPVPPQPPAGAVKPAAPKAPAAKPALKMSAKKQFANYKKPSKNKSLATGILAFLLAGGAVFVMMILMGTKDIKDQDARMNFSYGNVLAGAVAPLFEALGIDEGSLSDNATINRMENRAKALGDALSISDWLGITPGSSGDEDSGSKSGRDNFSSDYSDSRYSSEASAPIPRAEFGMSDGMGGMGGGSTGISSKGHQGANTFSSKAAQDVFKGDGKLTEGGQLPAMKGKNAINTLKASRQMLGSALTSGSATVARNNWSAAFGQSKALSGKSSGFANGKLNKEVFKDANAAALDKIESGEIKNLKLSDIDGKSGSVPTASVPKLLDNDSGGSKSSEDSFADQLGKQALQAAGDGAKNLMSGKDGEKSGSGGKDDSLPVAGQTPTSVSNIANKLAMPEESEPDYGIDDSGREYMSTFKDEGKPEYTQTPQGFWLAKFNGTETRTYVDEKGKEKKEKVKYTDTYLIVPGGNPEYQSLSSFEKDKTGRTKYNSWTE